MWLRTGLAATLAAALAAGVAAPAAPRSRAGVDPRSGGLRIALGEWTLAPEAKAITPGSVTFVVTNRGKLVHAFRIRTADASGKDRFEARTRALRPGETVRVRVDLEPGLYDIECPVDDGGIDHEERGMHALLRVAANAPLVTPAARRAPNRAAIEGFAYRPPTLTVKRGTTVRWTNADPTPQMVTAAKGSFSSPQLRKGGTHAHRFGRAGRFAYVCALHPQMKGVVVVK